MNGDPEANRLRLLFLPQRETSRCVATPAPSPDGHRPRKRYLDIRGVGVEQIDLVAVNGPHIDEISKYHIDAGDSAALFGSSLALESGRKKCVG